MSTISFPRKALFLAIFCASLVLPVGQVARAQEIPNAQIQELQATLITLLTQILAQLQAQLADLIAKQAITDQKVDIVVARQTVTATSTPLAGNIPLKSTGVYLGKYGSYDSWMNYVYTKASNSLEAQGFTPDLIQSISKTRVTVTSNKPIDPNKTELYVNGESKAIAISAVFSNSDRTEFDITPNVWSYATYDPTVFSSPRYDSSDRGTIDETVILKFYTSDGEVVSTFPVHCAAYATRDGSYNYLTAPRNLCYSPNLSTN